MWYSLRIIGVRVAVASALPLVFATASGAVAGMPSGAAKIQPTRTTSRTQAGEQHTDIVALGSIGIAALILVNGAATLARRRRRIEEQDVEVPIAPRPLADWIAD